MEPDPHLTEHCSALALVDYSKHQSSNFSCAQAKQKILWKQVIERKLELLHAKREASRKWSDEWRKSVKGPDLLNFPSSNKRFDVIYGSITELTNLDVGGAATDRLFHPGFL